MVAKIANAALSVRDVDALANAAVDGKPVSELVTDAIATIGENMSLRRMAVVTGETVVSYIHNSVTDGMGKIGVLVAVTGSNEVFCKASCYAHSSSPPGSVERSFA